MRLSETPPRAPPPPTTPTWMTSVHQRVTPGMESLNDLDIAAASYMRSVGGWVGGWVGAVGWWVGWVGWVGCPFERP